MSDNIEDVERSALRLTTELRAALARAEAAEKEVARLTAHGCEAAERHLAAKVRNRELEEALAFYADPETYFAIGFFPDPPCGEFMDDFSEVPDTDYNRSMPGKRARSLLNSGGNDA